MIYDEMRSIRNDLIFHATSMNQPIGMGETKVQRRTKQKATAIRLQRKISRIETDLKMIQSNYINWFAQKNWSRKRNNYLRKSISDETYFRCVSLLQHENWN